MIQLKTFNNTKTEVINEFLRTVSNAKIIGTNPIMIQYEIHEEKPLKIYNLTRAVKFTFQAGSYETDVNRSGLDRRVWDNFSVRVTKISIFEDYICFESKSDKAFYYLDSRELFDKKHKIVLQYANSDAGKKYKLQKPESFDINDNGQYRDIDEKLIVEELEDHGFLINR